MGARDSPGLHRREVGDGIRCRILCDETWADGNDSGNSAGGRAEGCDDQCGVPGLRRQSNDGWQYHTPREANGSPGGVDSGGNGGLSPQKRLFSTEEIASTTVYLARESARGINGQGINICGGSVFA